MESGSDHSSDIDELFDNDDDAQSLKDFLDEDEDIQHVHCDPVISVIQLLSRQYKAWPVIEKQSLLKCLNIYVDEPGLSEILARSVFSADSSSILMSTGTLSGVQIAMCKSFISDIDKCAEKSHHYTFWELVFTMLNVAFEEDSMSVSINDSSICEPRETSSSVATNEICDLTQSMQELASPTKSTFKRPRSLNATPRKAKRKTGSPPRDDLCTLDISAITQSVSGETIQAHGARSTETQDSGQGTLSLTLEARTSTPAKDPEPQVVDNSEDDNVALCSCSQKSQTGSSENYENTVQNTESHVTQEASDDSGHGTDKSSQEDTDVPDPKQYLNLLKNPDGDDRCSVLLYADRTHLKKSSQPDMRYKMWLCVCPGDVLASDQEAQVVLETALMPGTMIILCSEKNDMMNLHCGEPLSTLILIKTPKNVTGKAIAIALGPIVRSHSNLQHAVITPLTLSGYHMYFQHISKNSTLVQCGEEDELTKKKLNIAETETVNAFLKLCDYAEAQHCKPETSALNYCFETMPTTCPEYKILTKITNAAGQYRSFIENCKWMLIQREQFKIPALKEQGVKAKCLIWKALLETFKDYCDYNNLPRYWYAEIGHEAEHVQTWAKYRVINSQTNLERILIANGISVTEFVNTLLDALIHGTRRHRTMMFYSEQHMCGKSIIADAICKLVEGKRITLEERDGRDFVVSSAHTAGVVVIEDPSAGALKFIIRALRAHMDGDTIPINAKHQAITHAQYPPIIITTNVATTTQALKSRCKIFTFHKTIDQVFGNKQIMTIEPTEVAQLIGKYTMLPMCNGIYQDVIPLRSGTSVTQCLSDSLTGHSPFCKWMLYISRVAPTVRCPPCELSHGGRQHAVATIQRIAPRNCGLLLTKETIETARVFLLTEEGCLSRGDVDGNKILREKASRAAHIQSFVSDVMTPLSGLLGFLLPDIEHDFVEKTQHTWRFLKAMTSTSSKDLFGKEVESEDYLAINNMMTKAEIELRETQPRGKKNAYHQMLLDRLLQFCENHRIISPRNASGHFVARNNWTLDDMYDIAYGKLHLKESEQEEHDYRDDEDMYG